MPSSPPTPSGDWQPLFELARLLVTTILSALLSGFFVRHWQYREDFVENRLSDLMKEVDQAADLASSYWSRDRVEIEPNGEICEAELMAVPLRLAQLRSLVGDFFAAETNRALLEREGGFIRTLTGGDFAAKDRVKNPQTLRDIRFEAASYVNEIRNARRNRLDQSWLSRLLH
jgi:hypothetical protein